MNVVLPDPRARAVAMIRVATPRRQIVEETGLTVSQVDRLLDHEQRRCPELKRAYRRNMGRRAHDAPWSMLAGVVMADVEARPPLPDCRDFGTASPFRPADELAEIVDLWRWLISRIDGLRKRDVQALLLSFVGEMTYADIGRVMGVGGLRVKHYIERALRKLRRAYQIEARGPLRDHRS